jgi:hypothetical protein
MVRALYIWHISRSSRALVGLEHIPLYKHSQQIAEHKDVMMDNSRIWSCILHGVHRNPEITMIDYTVLLGNQLM